MADYNSAYTGSEIDQGVGNGLAAPTTYAPIAHDSTATTYGKGTDTKYGHLKLSDSTSSTSSTSGGIAATPAAVKSAYDLASSKQSVLTFDNSPTANSNNPVKSGGVYSALASKADSSDIPSAYTSNPEMDGTASPGTSTYWARGNHIHPTDTSRAAQSVVETLPRPNLLDNWDWRYPINSRGLSTYSGSSGTYTIDRWKIANNTVTVAVESGGVRINCSSSTPSGYRLFEQKVCHTLTTAWVTITARVTACTGTFRLVFGDSSDSNNRVMSDDITGAALVTVTGTLSSSVTNPIFAIQSRQSGEGNIKIGAVKLELGRTQTLVRDGGSNTYVYLVPANQAEETLRSSRGEEIDGSYDHGTALPLYRKEAFFSSDTTPSINGVINWTYG